MPLFHTAGCGMGVLGAAQRLAVHVPVLAFDPALVLELLESERAAFSGGVPTMMTAMLDHPDLEKRDLSWAGGGGVRRFAGAGRAGARGGRGRRVRFSIVFGTTQCSPLVTQVGGRRPRTGPRHSAPRRRRPRRCRRPGDRRAGATRPGAEPCARGYR